MPSILDPNGKVLVVEGSTQSRTSISTALREVGYKNSIGIGSLGDALSVLEVEEIVWLICPLILEGPVNTLQLLRMAQSFPEFRALRISAFYSEESKAALPLAFELGLLSCHSANYSKTALGQAMADLKHRIDIYKNDSCLIAASYIREMLFAGGAFARGLEFSQALLEQYAGNLEVLLLHAEAQALAGDKTGAASTLSQVLLIDASCQAKVDAVRTKHLPEVALGNASTGGANMLGIVACVVVDSDEITLNAVRGLMNMVGAKNVEYFSHPDAALKHLEAHPEPSLILHEWKLPKLNGPLFVQRIRQIGHRNVPIVVISSLVTEKDQHLTHEMGIAAIVMKPLHKDEFLKTVVWTMKQERQPTEIKVFERKILALLLKRKFREARELASVLFQSKKISEAVRSYFEAETAYYMGRFETAKEQAVNALKKGMISVRLFHLVGKILMKLGDFEAAIRCFEKAQDLSPLNILRLCALADAQSELNRRKDGQDAIDKAKTLDPDNVNVSVTEANFNLTLGDVKRAGKLLSQLDTFDEVLSYLNNRGVTLSKTGRADEAVEFYKRALEALPAKANLLQPVIRYNLALALVRAGDLDGGKKETEAATKTDDAKLGSKARSLRDRLEKAMKSGCEFKLNTTEVKSTEFVELPAGEHEAALEVLAVNPGELCCYKLYFAPTKDTKLLSLYQKLPAFRRRAAIVREASGGLERDIKSR